MKTSKLTVTGALVLTAATLFAGCAGVTHEPKVDVSTLKDITETEFFAALDKVGVSESDADVMEDTSFSFNGSDRDYDVEYNVDAVSEVGNYYSYTRCVDEATAKDLFDYYYSDYSGILDDKDFSGIKSYEIGTNTAYLLIDGRYDDKINNTYTPYHDAIYLKGNTVIIVTAADYDLSIEKEVNTFLDALGYPHP